MKEAPRLTDSCSSTATILCRVRPMIVQMRSTPSDMVPPAAITWLIESLYRPPRGPASRARGDLDVVLNGYEFSDQFRPMASVPYYIYRLTLTARAGDESIRSWDDLRAPPGGRKKKVGVLTGSAAQRYAQKTFGEDIDLLV